VKLGKERRDRVCVRGSWEEIRTHSAEYEGEEEIAKKEEGSERRMIISSGD